MRDLMEQNNDAEAANDQEENTEETEQPNPINDDSLQKTKQKSLTSLELTTKHKVSLKKQIHLQVSQMTYTLKWKLFSK